MSGVCVTGIGLVTALGTTRAIAWQNLLQGKSGVALVPLPDVATGASYPLAFVDRLSSPTPKVERPTPKVERLILMAVAEAIADAGLQPPLPECGLAIGSSRGYQRDFELAQVGGTIPSPLFPGFLSSSVARHLQTRGPVMAPMVACATGNWAIAMGYELIVSGQCDRVVVGSVDAAITPLSVAGFRQLGALAKTGVYPFSQEREGLGLGEGAAALVLEAESCVRRSRVPVYGRILGVGLTNDAYHPTTPDPGLQAAATAVRQCLARSGCAPEDIGYINAHGTATKHNDATEAALIGRIFPQRTAVGATKGATGHALGATGTIEAGFCLLALRHRILPPCTGLRSPVFDLNFVRAAREDNFEVALNFSFGFGGQNAIVAFGRA